MKKIDWNRVWNDFKNNMKQGGWKILTVFLAVWLLSSLLLWIFERCEVKSPVKNYWDALYTTWITMTTVGYGDYHPLSVSGKIVSCIDGLLGIVFIGVVVWIVTTSLKQD